MNGSPSPSSQGDARGSPGLTIDYTSRGEEQGGSLEEIDREMDYLAFRRS